MRLIFSQTVGGSSGDEEKVSCWWAEARCSYHVTLLGSESLWDWGGHKHSDKRGEKRRIMEEGGRWGGLGGRGDCYTKKSKKQGHLPHSPPQNTCVKAAQWTHLPRSLALCHADDILRVWMHRCHSARGENAALFLTGEFSVVRCFTNASTAQSAHI